MAKLSWSALLALAAVLVSAADVAGYHRPNALYTGTHSAGGQVEINTSADNSFVNRYRFTDVPCQGMPGASFSSAITYSVGGELITAHAASLDSAEYLFARRSARAVRPRAAGSTAPRARTAASRRP